MNRVLTLLCLAFLSGMLFAQRDLTPGGRRSSYFGKADYKDYRFYGLQFSAGPTFLKTRSENPTIVTSDATGRPIDYTIDPASRIGFFAEVGMAHFTQRRSKLAQAWKKVFISYYDYGIGFKQFSGTETTTVRSYAPDGSVINAAEGKGAFKNGYLYGRFSIHKNFYIGKKYFIDNGLGANVDYRLIEGTNSYSVAGITNNYNHSKLVAQLNYDLGFGIKLSRRSFLIPGVHLPIMSFYEWRGGCAALKWFDSNYLPIMAKVKLIYLFEKKAKGCNTPSSDEDRKRNEEYLQNN
jgi:hypothetical protein